MTSNDWSAALTSANGHHDTPDLLSVQLSAWRAGAQSRDAVYRTVSNAMLAETGLPLEWYEVLVHLWESGTDGMPQTELEEQLPISSSAVSRMLSKMQEAGLVARTRVPHDRRALDVRITDRGAERGMRATPVYIRTVHEAFGRHVDTGAANTIVSMLAPVHTHTGEQRSEDAATDVVSFGQTLFSVTADAMAVADAVQVRNALEPQLVLAAARQVPEEDAARLREAIGRMSAALADPEAFFRADWQLHRVLAQLCGNVTLRNIYLGLLDVIETHLEYVLPTEGLGDYLQRRLVIHAQLVDAVISGDTEQVQVAAHAHDFGSARAKHPVDARPSTDGAR